MPRRRERSGADPVTTADPRLSARHAGLRYSTDRRPGIERRRAGRGFSYRGADGQIVRERSVLARIRALAIPPAWTDVWICPDPNGHLQATGRDARGRKQYRYHARWRVRRAEQKFRRIVLVAGALPAIRRRCDRDLARRGLPRDKVLAAVVRLLELTLIRVGNDEYARLNRSFGLTTLRDRHAQVRGTTVRFRFRGKSGQQHDVDVRDRRLAAVVRRCQDLPGQELFQYVDPDGEIRDVASDDVNDYLRAASGMDVTARDFRIWAGTVVAYRSLRGLEPADDERTGRHNVIEAVRRSAGALRNTPAVARQSYVHPGVLAAYLDGGISDQRACRRADRTVRRGEAGSDADEAALIELLREPLGRDAARGNGSRVERG
jgi:DNA topoisomerase-1